MCFYIYIYIYIYITQSRERNGVPLYLGVKDIEKRDFGLLSPNLLHFTDVYIVLIWIFASVCVYVCVGNTRSVMVIDTTVRDQILEEVDNISTLILLEKVWMQLFSL